MFKINGLPYASIYLALLYTRVKLHNFIHTGLSYFLLFISWFFIDFATIVNWFFPMTYSNKLLLVYRKAIDFYIVILDMTNLLTLIHYNDFSVCLLRFSRWHLSFLDNACIVSFFLIFIHRPFFLSLSNSSLFQYDID